MSQSWQDIVMGSLFEASPDAIVVVDETGCIVLVNDMCVALFGHSKEKLLSQSVEFLIPSRARTEHMKQRERYEKSPHKRPMGIGMELLAVNSRDQEFPVEVSLCPISDGQKRGTIALIRDISHRHSIERQLLNQSHELEATNRELLRSNKDLEEFAYVASHDLQEPLRSIGGSCQLLERRHKQELSPAAQELIQLAVAGVRRMENLIHDLLSYSRISASHEMELVDLAKLVPGVLVDVKLALEESGATLSSDAMPAVRCNRVQVAQVFQNLISNAIKFRSAQPLKIHLGVQRVGDDWQFSVADNGIGIRPQHFERIFIIFKRLHTVDKFAGTGIGLSLCKKIVERHGGRIWVESAEGAGSTFFFTLPVVRATPRRQK